MIDVSNLTIGYKDTTVVKNLDFKLNKGEFIALIGANGAGKSTLINTLIGINTPLSGKISWELKSTKKNMFNDVGFSQQQFTKRQHQKIGRAHV